MVPEGLLTLSSPSLLGTLGTLVTQKPLVGGGDVRHLPSCAGGHTASPPGRCVSEMGAQSF